ncbi:MAG: Unknown protein [uncultured Aureispira sp.]|uniref:Uncharacterized protein n=1 Tax=uncultured Aureispira sp. TaxID=1331704 RepID=A0A6S6UEA2_9BACT|nr:MAG: Unknown protein [uncultured Aureispira sp.]
MEQPKLTLKDIFLLIAPVFIGVISLLMWWYELHQVIGGSGFGWLEESLRSIYLISFLIVLAFILPMRIELKMPIGWGLFYILLLYGASLGTYFLTKQIFYNLYTKGLIGGDTKIITLSIWKLLATVILLSAIYFIPMRHFHRKTDGMHILTIMVAMISVIPASLISIEQIPLWSAETAFIDAVKLGYPIFWMPIFLGSFSTAAAKEWI